MSGRALKSALKRPTAELLCSFISESIPRPKVSRWVIRLMMLDPFARTMDLLTLLLPLFSAAVSFWLGVAIEGRRADQNMRMAMENMRDAEMERDRRMTMEASSQ